MRSSSIPGLTTNFWVPWNNVPQSWLTVVGQLWCFVVAARSQRSSYFLLDPIALELEILGLVIGTLIVLLL